MELWHEPYVPVLFSAPSFVELTPLLRSILQVTSAKTATPTSHEQPVSKPTELLLAALTVTLELATLVSSESETLARAPTTSVIR